MFTIKADGRELYNPALFDEKYQVINPELTLEVNKAGSLTFTMPPCNVMWGSLNKLTSVITVEQDGIEIFRGRVMNDETDTWKQRSVYVEGELAYLLDSIQRPYEFNGNAVDLFKQFITNHNESVNAEKRFTIGRITAVDETTEAAIDASGAYGGYIRIRHENGIGYIDYLSESGDDNTQPIQLGVNLLDLKESISAEDVFTVLIPTGAMQNGPDGKFSDLLKISEANNGLDYLEDTEGIAKYGRIWKRKHWDYIEDPQLLKEAGQKYMKTGFAEESTLTITAVDMHFVDPSKQRIAIGDMVQILSEPHGLDRVTICYKIVMPLQEPEKTVYTFGEPKKALTDNMVRVEEATGGGGGGGGRTTEEEVKDIIRWAYARADEENALYEIMTGQMNTLTGDVSEAFIMLNGITETIASVTGDVDRIGGEISAIEGSALWQNRNNITGVVGKMSVGADGNVYIQEGSGLKIYKNGAAYGVYDEDNLTAGLLVEKLNGSTTAKIKADRIDLQGYVTMKAFETVAGWADNFAGDIISANSIGTGSIEADEISFGDLIGSRVQVSDSLTLGGQDVATQTWVYNRGYATQTWVNGQGFTSTATVDTKVNAVYNWVLENFATKTWCNSTFQPKS